jgi:hypothetical protein
VGAAPASPDTVLQGSAPVSSGSGASTTYGWQAVASNASTSNYTLGVFAVCAPEPMGYQLASDSVSIPINSYGESGVACPSGTVPLGGGALIQGAGNSSIELESSSPVPSVGWNVQSVNSSFNTYTLDLSVACADQAAVAGYVITTSNVGVPAGGSTTQTVSCPAGTVVLGGGTTAPLVDPGNELQESAPGVPGLNAGVSNLWLVAATNQAANAESLGLTAVCATP